MNQSDPNQLGNNKESQAAEAHFASNQDEIPTQDREKDSRSEPSTLLPNTSPTPIQVDGYEVLELLGQGGMGVVYRASQPKLNRSVALKLIRYNGQLTLLDIRRFRIEAESIARLQHPNIVQVFAVGEHEGVPFLALELCEGGSLARQLKQAPPTPQQAAEIVEKLAEAMFQVHQRLVIHRDLKPANILLTLDGTPKISDFGLARKLDQDVIQTQIGAVLGTPSYMAPEQARGQNHDLGPAVDIYALGAILYECLTGRPPFNEKSTIDTILQVIHNQPVPPRQLKPKVPRDLETICMKCLRKEPDKRYASVKELAEDLRRWLDHRPIQARPVSRLEKLWLWCKRRPTVAGSLLAILIATFILTGVSIKLQKENDLKRAKSHVENALTAPASALPYVMDLLEPLRQEAVPILQARFFHDETPTNQKLHAAMVLAEFGEVHSQFLLDAISSAPDEECANLISALQHVAHSRTSIRQQVEAVDNDWTLKARLAIVALYLGDDTIVKDMVTPRADPIQKTILIQTLPQWHGDLTRLAEIVRANQVTAVQGSICLAMSRIPLKRLNHGERQRWLAVLTKLYKHSPDAWTHSAVERTFRSWQVDAPTIAVTIESKMQQHWMLNRLGMTLIRIPPGEFTHQVTNQMTTITQRVVLSKPMQMSNQEVSLAQFQQFAEDPNCPENMKPTKWPGVEKDIIPTSAHPVHKVSWEEAILFCNWLSRKEGLTECYQRNQKQWHWQQDANGYRLPTEAEHQYALRAGTSTIFSHGNDDALLSSYALFFARHPEPCGLRLPNEFGLFNMQGNVKEWCWDYRQRIQDLSEKLQDPTGPAHGIYRMIRGGSYRNGVNSMRPYICTYGGSTARYPDVGFRVARTLKP